MELRRDGRPLGGGLRSPPMTVAARVRPRPAKRDPRPGRPSPRALAPNAGAETRARDPRRAEWRAAASSPVESTESQTVQFHRVRGPPPANDFSAQRFRETEGGQSSAEGFVGRRDGSVRPVREIRKLPRGNFKTRRSFFFRVRRCPRLREGLVRPLGPAPEHHRQSGRRGCFGSCGARSGRSARRFGGRWSRCCGSRRRCRRRTRGCVPRPSPEPRASRLDGIPPRVHVSRAVVVLRRSPSRSR